MWQKCKNVDGNDKGWIHEYDPLWGEMKAGEAIPDGVREASIVSVMRNLVKEFPCKYDLISRLDEAW